MVKEKGDGNGKYSTRATRKKQLESLPSSHKQKDFEKHSADEGKKNKL